MTLTPSKSRADVCDAFAGDSGDNTILVGGNAGSFLLDNKPVYFPLGGMAICWSDQNQIWHYVENGNGCDIGSTSSDYVWIFAGEGDDSVAANSVGHTCVLGYAAHLIAFDKVGFDFYMRADMGTGSDHAYGTSNNDLLYSNTKDFWFGNYPADNANDFVCGYDGNDTLYGDEDQSDSGYWPIDGAGHEERLNGGVGNDLCNGGDSEAIFDWAMVPDPNANWYQPIAAGGCNTVQYASQATSVGIGSPFENYAYAMKSAVCGSHPPDLWW